MDLFVQSFFVLLNSKTLIETPDKLKDWTNFVFDIYKNVVQEQLYLQDLGVSFQYTDSIDSFTRKDLINFAQEWNDLKKQNSK